MLATAVRISLNAGLAAREVQRPVPDEASPSTRRWSVSAMSAVTKPLAAMPVMLRQVLTVLSGEARTVSKPQRLINRASFLAMAMGVGVLLAPGLGLDTGSVTTRGLILLVSLALGGRALSWIRRAL